MRNAPALCFGALFFAAVLNAAAALSEDAPTPAFPEGPQTPKLEGDALKHVNDLVKQLGSDSFDDREKAEAELHKLGPSASGTLEAALKEEDLEPEARQRLQRVLADCGVEIWEGYFFTNQPSFDKAVEAQAVRMRFTWRIKRDAAGNFEGELERSGVASKRSMTVKGTVDRAKGTFAFDRSTPNNPNATHFEGTWDPKTGRVEGKQAEQQESKARPSGFVLFPRKLTDDEIQKFQKSSVDPNTFPK